MANKMDAPPQDKEETETPAGKDTDTADQGGEALLTVLEHLQKAETAVAEVDSDSPRAYNAIMDGKLPKMTAQASGFTRGAGQGEKQRCGTCWHMATFPARARKAVQEGACEITRPDDGVSVEQHDRCKFYTPDGEHFPFRHS